MPLITISGPSGAGKSTLISALKRDFNANLLPSWTTREKRPNFLGEEIYSHITKEQYIDKLKLDHFFLNSEVAGNYYGTTYEDMNNSINSTDIWLTDLTADSVLDLLQSGYTPSISIVLMISKEVSLMRMKARGDSVSSIEARLKRYDIEKKNCELLIEKKSDTILVDGEIGRNSVTKIVVDLLWKIHGN